MAAKTVLIVLVFILGALILFLGGYLLFRGDNASQTANILTLGRFSGENQGSSETDYRLQPLRRLSNVKVVSPAVSQDGKGAVFFEKNSGKIWTGDFTGQNNSLLSGKIIDGFSSAVWSPNGYEAVIYRKIKNTEKPFYYNLKNDQFAPLHQFIYNPVFSRNGQQIAYLFFDPQTESGSISVSSPDGGVFKNIMPTRTSNLRLDWQKESLVSFYGQNAFQQELYTLNIENGQLTKIVPLTEGLDVLWSPDGQRLLFSYYLPEEKSYKLKVKALDDQTETDIPVYAAASQCAWRFDSRSFYCGGVLKGETEQRLHLINLKNMEIETVFSPSEPEEFVIKNPLLSPTEDFLVFVSNDQYLYSIYLR